MQVPTITSHILDTSRGAPALGLRVILEHRNGDGGELEHHSCLRLSESFSDSDGRCPNLLSSVPVFNQYVLLLYIIFMVFSRFRCRLAFTE